MKREHVILVTVTYNSSHFLDRLVRAAAGQTYPVEKIVAVDNASSPEHAARLAALKEEFPQMEILRSPENLGGAGGFEMGVDHVLKTEPDCQWIWIMDDDAFPREDCLEQLLRHKDLPDAGCLTPMIFGVELQQFQLYHHKLLSKYLEQDHAVIEKREGMDEIVPVESNAFVGPLFKTSVMREIGIPDGGLFIYGDDTEYTYRLTRCYRMYLVRDAVINHRDIVVSKDAVNPKGFWKDYYQYRNRWLFITKYQKNGWHGFVGKLLLLKKVMWFILRTIKRPQYKGVRLLRIRCVLCGIWDGLLGKSGKTWDPAEFCKKLS